jgi:hypothetical protein
MHSHTPYTEFRYILPPRTKAKAPFDPSNIVIRSWMRMPDAVAQLKLNGSRNLIFISPDDQIQFWNRHKEQHRNYAIPQSLTDQIRGLPYPKGSWNVLDSELLHFKTPTIKNCVYLFDVLVWGGEYLIGDTYGERYSRITPMLKSREFPIDKTEMSEKIFVAQNIAPADWANVWAKVQQNKAVEGLVLKRTGPASSLKIAGSSENNNGDFMCRIRKPFGNALF